MIGHISEPISKMEVFEGKPTVLITGVSGYLGSHVCLAFLKHGGFNVRGTVRDKSNRKKLEPLIHAFGDELFSKLELVEADLLNKESIFRAIEGCTYVIHTASPFMVRLPKDENDLIRPAVQGTMAVMRGAHMHKVQRVVITSSVASMHVTRDPNKTTFNVDDWSDLSIGNAYDKSKTLAERSAWDFLDSLPPSQRFELVSINPGLILGPSFVTEYFQSGDLIRKLMDGSYPGMPDISFAVCDVRDTADAHLKAVLVPEARNRRFIVVHSTLKFRQVGQWLYERFG